MTVKIYSLSDPRDRVIRYIGVTKLSLKKRLSGHMSDSKRGEHNHRRYWICGLVSAGITPRIDLIEEIEDGLREEREMHWIAHFRANGFNLVNSTDGGDGFVNVPRDVMLRGYRKSAESRKGLPKSKSAREKYSLIAYERWRNPDFKKKMSDITKANLSNPETKDRLLAGIKRANARPETIEHKCEAAKKSWILRREKYGPSGGNK